MMALTDGRILNLLKIFQYLAQSAGAAENTDCISADE